METVVTRDTIAAFILCEMNVGVAGLGKDCVHRDFNRNFNQAYLGCKTTRGELETLAGDSDWATFDVSATDTLDLVNALTGIEREHYPLGATLVTGNVDGKETDFIVVCGDSGMDDFYFLFQRIVY